MSLQLENVTLGPKHGSNWLIIFNERPMHVAMTLSHVYFGYFFYWYMLLWKSVHLPL